MQYSSNPEVDDTVAKLIRTSFEKNPFTLEYQTIANVREVVAFIYGKRAARAVRITVH